MYDLTSADLLDDVLAEVRHTPGLPARKIAKRLRADAGRIRKILTFLTSEHYVTLTRQGGQDTYTPTA